MALFLNKSIRKNRPGSVANSERRKANNTRRNANNARKRVEHASNNILNTAVQRVHNNAFRRKDAGTMNANQNAQMKKNLERIEGIRSELSAATKRVVDESLGDIKEQAIRFSKNEDPTLLKKLEKQLTKVLLGDTRSPSDPKVKAILKWVLPIFLFTAPYIRYKGFKYNASSKFYDYLKEFVANMKHDMAGGASDSDTGNNSTTSRSYMGFTSFWSMNFMSSMLMFNLGSLDSGGSDLGPFVAFILMFYIALIMVAVGLSVGAVTLNVFTYIGSAVYNRIKKMTKSKGADVEDAKHEIVVSNILSEMEVNKIVAQENPSYQVQNPSYQVQNPSYQVQNPSYQVQNPSYQVQNPSYYNQNPPYQTHHPSYYNQNPPYQTQNPSYHIKPPSSEANNFMVKANPYYYTQAPLSHSPPSYDFVVPSLSKMASPPIYPLGRTRRLL